MQRTQYPLSVRNCRIRLDLSAASTSERLQPYLTARDAPSSSGDTAKAEPEKALVRQDLGKSFAIRGLTSLPSAMRRRAASHRRRQAQNKPVSGWPDGGEAAPLDSFWPMLSPLFGDDMIRANAMSLQMF
jgi:hypothetical protein